MLRQDSDEYFVAVGSVNGATLRHIQATMNGMAWHRRVI